MSFRDYPWRYALFFMAYYAANSVFQGYMSLYYAARGLDAARIGAIFSAIALVSAAAQPCWGLCADRARSRNRVLRLLAAGSCATALSFLLADRFLPLLLLGCLFSCFYTSIQPMGDSIALTALNEQNQPFGPVRLAGGVTFALASLAFGALIDVPGREALAVWCTAALCLTVIPASYALPDTPGYQSRENRRMSIAALLKDRELMRLMLFLLPMQMTMGYFYTFFSPMFLTFDGANGTLLGWCYFIATIGEIPYLLLSDRLYDRFGAGRLMCAAGAALALRWLLLALTRNVAVIMASQLLHGWGFIVMTVAMAKHISRTVPAELQATGQMLLAVVSYGFARAIGNLGGGLLAGALGQQNVFYLTSGICLLSLVLFAPSFFRRRRA